MVLKRTIVCEFDMEKETKELQRATGFEKDTAKDMIQSAYAKGRSKERTEFLKFLKLLNEYPRGPSLAYYINNLEAMIKTKIGELDG